jgi:hypothetical protein
MYSRRLEHFVDFIPFAPFSSEKSAPVISRQIKSFISEQQGYLEEVKAWYVINTLHQFQKG